MKTIVTGLIVACVGSIVISLVFTGQSYAKIDPKSVVGMWLFNEGKGNKAKDSSENANDGELIGDVKLVDGKYGMAFEFENGYVDCGKNPSMDLEGQDITIAALVKTDMGLDDGYHAIAQNGRGPGSSQLHFNAAAGNPFISWNPIPNVQLQYPVDLTDDKWHYIVAVFDDSKNKSSLYIDGQFGESVSEPNSIVNNPDSLWLGSDWAHPKNKWIGEIDEIAIFSEALTEDDIMSIMAHGLEGFMAVYPGGRLLTSWGNLKAGY